MATHKASTTNKDDFVFVFDRREKDAPEQKIPTSKLKTFAEFKDILYQTLDLHKSENFLITTTNREVIQDDASWAIVDSGDTLYILKSLDQELCAPAEERVNYLPHYDTIVKGGMYEYYASEGQDPLPYAFAELIDNSLAATRNNTGPRTIEIRLHLEESTVYVIDNGKGMTSRQLNNWAIYRLSKFIRKDKRSKINLDDTVEEEESFVDNTFPKSLNSDISYFGVGGKQAVFFIGESARMISKPVGSQDVHELTISKADFEKKEKNHEEIYSGFIINRKVGDASHIPPEDDILRKLIEEEETTRDSFTVVVIQGISKNHLVYLRDRINEWPRQLAHIYHYYLHGPNGNVPDIDGNNRCPSPFKNIDIEVKLWQTKGQADPKVVNLRDIDDDMQSLFVRGAASIFEFKAIIEGTMIVEGVMRYHPFLYDRETYPLDIYDRSEQTFEDEHDYAISEQPARGRRPIFECFWNGRLIPYTFIDGFDWCNPPKKARLVPAECYNRVSGVLWTDDHFQVSTNKLTFIDFELKLRDKQSVFTRIVNGQEKRTSIEKEFSNWLKECHELHDKQIHFTQYQGLVVRLDLPKQRQTPWASYKQVDWDGKIFKTGQLVRILRTVPTLLGSINRILLYGDHMGDVYATGGDLEIIQEPRSMYNEVKIVPLSKLDRTASSQLVKKHLDEEEAKLPSDLEITWPEGNAVLNNEKRQAGRIIGDIKVEILNKKGDKVSKLPGKDQAAKKLLVELKVIWHSPQGPQTIVSLICQHGKNWPYWFRKIENLKNIGTYTLQLNAVLNESGENMFAGKQLPCKKINFQVVEGVADRFTVGHLDGPVRVGVPFNIPLDLFDSFDNPGMLSVQELKPVLGAVGLELTYSSAVMKGNSVVITDVVAKGNVSSNTGKNYSFSIKIPELKESTQTLKIRLLPGPATVLSVFPEDEQTVINGCAPEFKVQLQDSAGNPTSLEGHQHIVCKLHGSPGLPTYSLECSSTGSGTLTGEPIVIKKMLSEMKLTAKIEIQGSRLIKTVERSIKLVPSGKVCEIQLFYQESYDSPPIKIENGMEIVKSAGESLDELSFKLFDEAVQEIPIDDKIVSKVKVNWTAKVAKDLAMNGQLPSIKVPTIVNELKYCQVSVSDSRSIDMGFVLKAVPGEPNQVRCSCSTTNTISIGQPLDSEIHVKVKDKFANDISFESDNVCQEIVVSGDGLKENRCKVTLDKSNKFMIIKGVVFEGGTIGRKELQISWRNLKDYVRLEMVAGPPAQLKFIDYDPDESVVVYNETELPKPIMVQLVDEGGNISKTPNVRMQLSKDIKLKLIPNVQPAKTNKDGVADFGSFTVSCSSIGNFVQQNKVSDKSAKMGEYDVVPKAFISTGFVITGPKLHLLVQPDPTRPCNLDVSYNKTETFIVGENIPEFTVKVLAEGDTLLGAAQLSHISLKLWKSNGPDENNLPSRTLSYSPDANTKLEAGVFHFRNITLPEESGLYNIMFVFYDGKHQLFSNVIHIKLEPSDPIKLVAVEPPGTVTVSNARNSATRCITRNLKLEIRDRYNNPVSKEMNGNVHLEVQALKEENEIPQLVGGAVKKEHTLAFGACLIQNISLIENCPGKDGEEYVLKCIPKVTKSKLHIQPYILHFLFYNDAKKQSEMAELSKERDQLQNTIKTYKSLFETTEQLIEELKTSVKETMGEENRIKEELRKQKFPVDKMNTVESVDKFINEFTDKKEVELSKKRRTCALPVIMANDLDVIGKIGHLAQIADDDAARVLSWHMSSDMDCIVTTTTAKAQEIYKQTGGRQQVLPLDSIFKRSLTEWNKPLPHAKYRPNWKPSGNLMFARNLLTFPQNADQCRTVFSMLLGETLWIDTLDQANEYRKELVKFTNCPTILTRSGDRIRSNGKFGGLMNKAPSVERLKGVVFGEPVPESYYQLCSTIDILHNLRSAIVVHNTAEKELNDQMETISMPEMQAKYEECQEVEKQLKQLEQKLGVSTSDSDIQIPRLIKRSHEKTVEDDIPASKRLKSSPVIEANGTACLSQNTNLPNQITPSRQSRRIAAMTATTDSEGRKKLKKS